MSLFFEHVWGPDWINWGTWRCHCTTLKSTQEWVIMMKVAAKTARKWLKQHTHSWLKSTIAMCFLSNWTKRSNFEKTLFCWRKYNEFCKNTMLAHFSKKLIFLNSDLANTDRCLKTQLLAKIGNISIIFGQIRSVINLFSLFSWNLYFVVDNEFISMFSL